MRLRYWRPFDLTLAGVAVIILGFVLEKWRAKKKRQSKRVDAVVEGVDDPYEAPAASFSESVSEVPPGSAAPPAEATEPTVKNEKVKTVESPPLASAQSRKAIPLLPLPLKTVVLDDVLEIEMPQLWRLIFADAAFQLAFKTKRRNRNITLGRWSLNDDGTAVRKVTFVAPLRNLLIGITSAFCEEGFTSAFSPEQSFLVDVRQTMPKVPYGSSFHCRQQWVAIPVGANRTRLQVSFEVVWVKPCPFYKELTTGLTEAARRSFQSYRAHLLEHVPSVVTISGLLHKASSGLLLPPAVHRQAFPADKAKASVSLVLVTWYLLPLVILLFMMFRKNEVAGLLIHAEEQAMGVQQLLGTHLSNTNGLVRTNAAQIPTFLNDVVQAASQRVQATRGMVEQFATTGAASAKWGARNMMYAAGHAADLAHIHSAAITGWARDKFAWLLASAKTLAGGV